MPRVSRPNVVDSSAWLAYFADESGADHFAAPIEDAGSLVVPAICLIEVFKVIARQRDEGAALQAIALMQQGRVIDLDATLALSAAKASIDHKLPLADSFVYATAGQVNGIVWTQDADFEGLDDVRFFPKKKAAR
jgi:uncharacterized protein with PIN domain